MKAMIPKQHGAWAMLLIPFLLGMIKGGPVFWHIPLFLGWLFLYLTVYPVSLALKKTASALSKVDMVLRFSGLLLFDHFCLS